MIKIYKINLRRYNGNFDIKYWSIDLFVNKKYIKSNIILNRVVDRVWLHEYVE